MLPITRSHFFGNHHQLRKRLAGTERVASSHKVTPKMFQRLTRNSPLVVMPFPFFVNGQRRKPNRSSQVRFATKMPQLFPGIRSTAIDIVPHNFFIASRLALAGRHRPDAKIVGFRGVEQPLTEISPTPPSSSAHAQSQNSDASSTLQHSSDSRFAQTIFAPAEHL